MPSDWAASGAKLALPNLELRFGGAPTQQQQERLLGGPSQQLSLQPLNQPSFVGKEGLTCVEVGEVGAYSITNARVGGDYDSKAHFRFYLDFPKGATRNDVVLPAERVFFTSTCWIMNNHNELETIHAARTASQQELKDVSELYGQLQVDDGVLQQTLRMRSKILLKERIEELERLHAEQEQHLPPDDDSSVVYCNKSDIVFAKEGYMTVKRKGGILGLQEQYHIVGTFELNEFYDDVSVIVKEEDTASSSSS